MVIYECKCGYRTDHKNHMKKHLNRVTSCGFSDTQLIGLNMSLSSLSSDKKKERQLLQISKNKTRQNLLGNMEITQYANYILKNMKGNSKLRGHDEVLWTNDDIIKLLEDNNPYKVRDTLLGDIEFPMKLSNGFHNSASFDRINDNLGYSKDNIEIRPYFLNTQFKLDTQDLKKIIELREQFQTLEELTEMSKIINSFDSKNFFYKLANSAKKRNKSFNFIDIRQCGLFLIKKYIEQGGRCLYSNIPIYPKTNHKYRISIERKDPSKGYNRDNIVLIVVGLNGKPSGQFLNQNLTEEERKIALKFGIFNQTYWDTCTKMTDDIDKKCKNAREYGKKILTEKLSIRLD